MLIDVAICNLYVFEDTETKKFRLKKYFCGVPLSYHLSPELFVK